MIAYYDFQPKKLEKIKSNKYFYRWNIEKIETYHRGDPENPITKYKCNEITFNGTPNSNIILEKVIKSLWNDDREKKLINDYNSAKEGLLDEKYIQKYLNFLTERAQIKIIVDSDCAELGIK